MKNLYNIIVVSLTVFGVGFFMYLIYNEYAYGGEAARRAIQQRLQREDSLYKAVVFQSRAVKDAEFRQVDSPLLPEVRDTFKGLLYYLPDTNYRCGADFEPLPEEIIPLPDGRKQRLMGQLKFFLRGEVRSLRAYTTDPNAKVGSTSLELFVPFRDGTTNETTYGGGRLVDVIVNSSNESQIDFNLAYHPYCLYNPRYVCPIPPQENTLPIRIEAGERLFPQPLAGAATPRPTSAAGLGH